MFATIFRNVSLCMFVCNASLRKRTLNKGNVFYEIFVLFDNFLLMC